MGITQINNSTWVCTLELFPDSFLSGVFFSGVCFDAFGLGLVFRCRRLSRDLSCVDVLLWLLFLAVYSIHRCFFFWAPCC